MGQGGGGGGGGGEAGPLVPASAAEDGMDLVPNNNTDRLHAPLHGYTSDITGPDWVAFAFVWLMKHCCPECAHASQLVH